MAQGLRWGNFFSHHPTDGRDQGDHQHEHSLPHGRAKDSRARPRQGGDDDRTLNQGRLPHREHGSVQLPRVPEEGQERSGRNHLHGHGCLPERNRRGQRRSTCDGGVPHAQTDPCRSAKRIRPPDSDANLGTAPPRRRTTRPVAEGDGPPPCPRDRRQPECPDAIVPLTTEHMAYVMGTPARRR